MEERAGNSPDQDRHHKLQKSVLCVARATASAIRLNVLSMVPPPLMIQLWADKNTGPWLTQKIGGDAYISYFTEHVSV
jgi:hypothetical protein